MGNNQIYKLCTCSQNQDTSADNQFKEHIFEANGENGKMAKNEDETLSQRFKALNIASVQTEKDKIPLSAKSESTKEPMTYSETNSSIVRVELGEGKYYEGPLLFGKYNGHGKLFINEALYIGEFRDGYKDGKGEIYDPVNKITVFTGYFERDEKHGKGNYNFILGIENFPDGSKYEGDYHKGKKQGKGRLEITKEKKYVGDFFNDKIEGFGTFIFTDKKFCQGNWKNNELNGLSIFIKEDKIHKGKMFLIFRLL